MSEHLCDLLRIRHPVLLAGMAGGPTTPELVAAVSRGGGLGVFGINGMTVDAVRAAVSTAVEAAGGAPVGVNVLLAGPTEPTTDEGTLTEGLRGVRICFGLEAPMPPPLAAPRAASADLVAAALESGASVVSVGLGDPAPVVDVARAAGAPVVAMVTTAAEAEQVVASGADVVVAQGWEAGGHRSTFLDGPGGDLPAIGTFALVPQVVRAVTVPVVAAGGVMDGAGIAAALCLGAQGVQMGTRFLGTRQSGVSEAYRARLRAAADDATRITRGVSGRPARGIPNTLTRTLDETGHLGWPRQAAAIADVRRAAVAADDPEHFPLWSGQNAGAMSREADDAEHLVATLMSDARDVLRRTGASLPG